MDWQVQYGDPNTPVKVLNKGKEVFSLDDPAGKQEFMKLAQPAQGQVPDMAKIQTFLNTQANQNKMQLPPDFVLANAQEQQQVQQPQASAQAPVAQPEDQQQITQPDEQIDMNMQMNRYEYEGTNFILEDDSMILNAFKRKADVMLPETDGKSIWKQKQASAKKHMQENASKLESDDFVGQMAEIFEADSHATNSDTDISTAIRNVKGDIKVKKDDVQQDVNPADQKNNATPMDSPKEFKSAKEYMDKKLSKSIDNRIQKPLEVIAGRENTMDKGQPEDAENLKTDLMSTPGTTQKGYQKPEEIKRSKTGFGKMESSKNFKKLVAEKYGISEGEAEYMVEASLDDEGPACDKEEKECDDKTKCGHCGHMFKCDEKKPTCPKCHKKFRA